MRNSKMILAMALAQVSFAMHLYAKAVENEYELLAEDNLRASRYDRTNLKEIKNLMKMVKISNEGRALTDEAVLGAGPNDWGCTYAEFTNANNEIQKVIWEIKTTDGGFRDMKWSYSWFDSRERWNNSQNQPVSGYKLGRCISQGKNSESRDCNTEQYIADVNTQRLCGLSQWRLPTESELTSIIICPNGFKNYGYAGQEYYDGYGRWILGFQCADDKIEPQVFGSFFTNIYDDAKARQALKRWDGTYTYSNEIYLGQYWSSTRYNAIEGSKWRVNFKSGAKDYTGASELHGVILIHDAENFVLNEPSKPLPPVIVTPAPQPPPVESSPQIPLTITAQPSTSLTQGDSVALFAENANEKITWHYQDLSGASYLLGCDERSTSNSCYFYVPVNTPPGTYVVFAKEAQGRKSNSLEVIIIEKNREPIKVVKIEIQKVDSNTIVVNNSVVLQAFEKLTWEMTYMIPFSSITQTCKFQSVDPARVTTQEITQICKTQFLGKLQLTGVNKSNGELVKSSIIDLLKSP